MFFQTIWMPNVRNVRRYFRLDVLVPAVVKLADKDEVVRMVLPELAGGVWHRQELLNDRASVTLLDKLEQENNTASKVLHDLLSRLTMLAESIVFLVQGEIPQDNIKNYVSRRKMAALITHIKTKGYVVDLLHALNDKIEFYFSIVDTAANKNYPAFLDMINAVEFSFDSFRNDLMEKSSKENGVLAQSILSLHEKLERHVMFLDKFRQEAQYMVDKESWPIRKLNLSAGGVGILSSDIYPKFARLVIQFRIGVKQESFHFTGNLISSRALSNDEHYLAIEFTNATEELQNRLIILLQNEELNQVMAYLNNPDKPKKAEMDW
jgi:hypothetical protein